MVSGYMMKYKWCQNNYNDKVMIKVYIYREDFFIYYSVPKSPIIKTFWSPLVYCPHFCTQSSLFLFLKKVPIYVREVFILFDPVEQ